MNRTSLMFTALAAIASPLAAQQHHAAPARRAQQAAGCPGMSGGHMMMGGMDSTMMQGMMMPGMMMPGMDSMMAPMHALMAFAPAHLLERRTDLQLDNDQADRLTHIAAQSRASADSGMSTAMMHSRELSDVVKGSGDPTAATTHFTAMHDAMGLAHAAMLRAALQARAVLTPGQRERAAQRCGGAPQHH